MTSKHLSLPLTGNLRDRGTQGRTLWLLVILVANLAVTFGLWFLAFGNIGGFWLAVGYDWRVMISGAVMASQLVSLALWASLCEPRSPFRWLWLALLAAASAAAMAGALVPAAMLARTGSRWGRWALPWGVVVWESYVTFMLVLCAAVVFLLAADIVAARFRLKRAVLVGGNGWRGVLAPEGDARQRASGESRGCTCNFDLHLARLASRRLGRVWRQEALAGTGDSNRLVRSI
jgi:MFS family permease